MKNKFKKQITKTIIETIDTIKNIKITEHYYHKLKQKQNT